MTSILHSLLELGHMTSQNLGFAQQTHGGITFGEETITETNLLELRRRHPRHVHVHSFTKATESKTTGADWEWHIIGRVRTLKMRVQAKRIYKAGGIGNLKQHGSKASIPQIDLLLQDATANRLLPIYCFYCSEAQRQHWKLGKSEASVFEAGCLITDAHVVKAMMPGRLSDIEAQCVPWHYLISRARYSRWKGPYMIRFKEETGTMRYLEEIAPVEHAITYKARLPAIAELNGRQGEDGERQGLHATLGEPLSVAGNEVYRERGISKLIQIDMRQPDHPF
jgi:hypothetical protein